VGAEFLSGSRYALRSRNLAPFVGVERLITLFIRALDWSPIPEPDESSPSTIPAVERVGVAVRL
jgi:hypothetical protein